MIYFDKITLDFLRESQWFTETEMYELRLGGLQNLLTHAKQNVPYYKDIPIVKDLETIECLPMLTKDLIHENYEELIARNIPHKRKWTGGTIQVVNIEVPINESSLDAGKHRFLEWQGTETQQREAILWGRGEIERTMGITRPTIRGNKIIFPIEQLNTKDDAIKYLEMIRDFKPTKIRGYPSAMVVLAHYALEEGIEYTPNIIETNCEPLTQYKKEMLKKAFNCPVFIFYGSQDLGSMAQNCEKDEGLHLWSERYILERSEENRFLWTDLLNYAMPLIRYENGDEGKIKKEKCSCGRNLPLLHETLGRTLYFLLTKNNKWLNMTEIHEFMYWSIKDFLKLVDKHQVIQTEKGKAVVILKIWDMKEKPNMTQLIERNKNLGLDIEIKWTDKTEDIKLSPSGKMISCMTPFRPPWLGKETSFPERI